MIHYGDVAFSHFLELKRKRELLASEEFQSLKANPGIARDWLLDHGFSEEEASSPKTIGKPAFDL